MKKICAVLAFVGLAAAAFAQDIPLKEPPAKLGMDVLDSIRVRSTARSFLKGEVPIADLSTILWAGNGLKGPDAVSGASKAGRTIAYSGDNAYINVYVLMSMGVFRYEPAGNLLKQVSTKDERGAVTPENIPTGAFMVLFTGDTTKAPSFAKGNPAFFHDIANATASYGAQNIALVAAGLKLSSIIMYNIKPDAAAAAAKLPKEEVPLFIMQLGYTR